MTWAGERVAAKDWPGAAEVLAEGLRALPNSSDLQRNAAYSVQEWTAASLADSGVEGFLASAEATKSHLADLLDLQEVFASVLGRDVERIVNEDRHEEAFEIIEACRDLIGPDAATGLKEFVYDRWARAATDSNNWAEAVRIYDLGLRDMPQSTLLKQNRNYTASKLP